MSEIGFSGWPDDKLYVNIRADFRLERAEDNDRYAGPGSLRLLTMATVWDGDTTVQAGWMAALPWTSDHGDVLTDERDVWLLSGISRAAGPGRVGVTGGLAILGNPLRFANQDDAPLLWLTGAAPAGDVALSSRIGGALGTSRNPSRLTAAVSAERGDPWRIGVTAEIGLTRAAADLHGGVWLARRWGCESARCD